MQKAFIEALSKQNQDFVIVGLTGRVRSGTSDIAKLLTSDVLKNSAIPVNTQCYDMSEIRELKVMHRYLDKKWNPFIELSVTSVIVSFLLDSDLNILEEYKLPEPANEITTAKNLIEKCLSNGIKDIAKRKLKQVYVIMKENHLKEYKPNFDTSSINVTFEKIFEKTLTIDMLLEKWKAARECVVKRDYKCIDAFIFCYGILPAIAEKMKELLKKDEEFTILFQELGNNIRAYGKAVYIYNDTDEIDAKNLFVLPERLNQFIKVLRYFTVVDRSEVNGSIEIEIRSNPVFVLINNLKNIFEAFYFRRRFSAFYLMAVSCDEKSRKLQFKDTATYRKADLRENLSSAKKVYNIIAKYFRDNDEKREKCKKEFEEKNEKKVAEEIRKKLGISEDEMNFCLDVFFNNSLRKKSYDEKLAPFIMQDIMACIENADIIVSRNHNEIDYKADYTLIRSLARFATLVLHPALLTPTKIERCMQIAMTAKFNSGCLSRQVGAVVTDKDYNILSIGWNDAPCGVESCMRRNLFDLFKKRDEEAYSEYELNDETFRSYIAKVELWLQQENIKKDLAGLPAAFCFKDIHQDIIKERDQIYTRALHAEERALAACGNDRANGGYLFTTSSPCELCAKKAKEANISRIYYIEQYPGISHAHVIDAGPKAERAKYDFFVGAVGLAYIKLYTPLVPYKDELAAFRFSVKEIHDKVTGINKSDIEKTTEKDVAGISKTPCENTSQVQQEPKQH